MFFIRKSLFAGILCLGCTAVCGSHRYDSGGSPVRSVVESEADSVSSGPVSDSVYSIKEVEITAVRSRRDVIPMQKLDGKELEKLSSHSVADALRYFSGLQVKDYGGVGGIKTVNIRSMGTNHLGVFYDGVELGNAQNGQIDLGQFSLDNVDEISLYNGQKSQIFQSAADFGNAGSVYIRTRRPSFGTRNNNVKAKFRYASSDTYKGSLLYECRLSKSLSASVNVGALSSSGKYKFRYRRMNMDGTTAYDTTAIRQNGDIWAFRGEANVFGLVDRGSWSAKLYTYHSERGIPGAIVNNVWRRGERQWDHNTFGQVSLQKTLTPRMDTKLKMKYAYYDTHYVNNDTTQMPVDNTYRQQEIYVSTANVYEISRGWSASLSYDFKWNRLDSDMRNFVNPRRYQNMASLATAFDSRTVTAQASLLATFVKDHTDIGMSQPARHEYTPALFVSVRPMGNDMLTLRAYAKKSFRMPTFNDLYYTDIGNAMLKPEAALQYDLGFTLGRNDGRGLLKAMSIQADMYYNSIHDKIVAYPKGQQFRWTMLNLGRVHITGVDVSAGATASPVRNLTLTSRIQYTYQKAIDVTDPADTYYRNQIPYIPWHSGSFLMSLSYMGFDMNYSFIYAGERYSQKENIRYNYLQPWYTSDISFTYKCCIAGISWRMTVEVNNLFSQDYDVILNYPMPKRNYGITLEASL
ncbi:TonB-dependent receptor plug domain-containing protein [Xylanibacter muris]|uniref:TonB-dependent receptor plug domain-containing protein n=1 Tax=Xylanibacter muris TaxID=2736290 RepID=A0ABX2ALR3_9BACT|nr:TonB-dependent receptor plug domain-containing protein [Xylanibacter muris]NPD92153.1 TonB-dependent receptor plug domain-containing protein [Xylanibacter muris]